MADPAGQAAAPYAGDRRQELSHGSQAALPGSESSQAAPLPAVIVGSEAALLPAVIVRRVPAEFVHPLRHAVLRTGRRWADGVYPEDTDPLSAHFAAVFCAPGAVPGSADAPGGDAGGPGDADGPGDPDEGLAVDAVDAVDAVVLAVGSVLPEQPDWTDPLSDGGGHRRAWRVRGMAARSDSRGSGLGSRILGSLLAHVGSNGGGLVWCTARIPAMSLYEHAGFEARGERVAVPGLGAHQVMWVNVPGGHLAGSSQT